VIEDDELRGLMMKGAKFRESPNPNFLRMESQISEALEDLVGKWSDKERNVKLEDFGSWIGKVKHKVRKRIEVLKAKCRRSPNTGEILKRNDIKETLNSLHQKYVICVVDKAANNFSIVCKKFYLIRLAQELGVDTGSFRNETYCRVNQTEEELCAALKDQIEDKFELSIPENYLQLPILHWIPKFHKNPIKYRFIAGSREKVLTILEIEIQKVLTLLESHFKNYCEVIRSNSGYKYFFSINNSKQALDMLNNVSNPQSFDSFDFSNLYTNFEHDDLLEKFRYLLDLLFTNAEKKSKGDCIRTENRIKGKARWCIMNEENLRRYSNQKFWTKSKIMEGIEFLVKNAYVKFGNLIFRQACGIPMGMIPAPGFAKLGLAVDEFKFCKELVANKRTVLIRKMINLVRYIDDIGTANFEEFYEIAKEIYPSSLTLNKSNESSVEDCSFLDLNVSIVDENFQIKVYNKTDDYSFRVITFPYLESNILTSICYSVYFGEALRYLRISSRLQDFEHRLRKLTEMLLERSYNKKEMAKQLLKLFLRYRQDARKFRGSLVVEDSVHRVVYGIAN
tara:strand:+ start:2018 stop:3712 length:1695 start_codon:yes stop_codon:yes gene_type:complete